MQHLKDCPTHRMQAGMEAYPPLQTQDKHTSLRNKLRGAKGPNLQPLPERGELRATREHRTGPPKFSTPGPTLTQAQEHILTLALDQIFFFFSFRACSQLGDDPSDLEGRVQRSQKQSLKKLNKVRTSTLQSKRQPGAQLQVWKPLHNMKQLISVFHFFKTGFLF